MHAVVATSLCQSSGSARVKKYNRHAAAVLEAAGVSAAALAGLAGSLAAAELVQRQRLLMRAMQTRMAEFAAGGSKNRPHTVASYTT